MNHKDILSYLEYGYIPKVDRCILDNKILGNCGGTIEENPLETGIKTLLSSFDSCLKKASKADHLVPLSGGLDSRAILAVLKKKINPSSIQSVTFGVPGTWDYEIGKVVAQKASVLNDRIDLSKHKFTEEELLTSAKTCERPTPLFERAVNSLIHQQYQDVTYWSGFMGEALAGAHLPGEPINDWMEALDYFVEHNRITSRLTPEGFDPKSVLPSSPITERLEFAEQLDYAIRQPCFIKPTVLDQRAMTPFLEEEWVSYCMQLPRTERVNRRFFKKIVVNAFPDLFSLPTDSNHGLSLTAPAWKTKVSQVSQIIKRKVSKIIGFEYTHPGTNYLDFKSSFRGRMASLVENQLSDLERRGRVPWVNIDKIWHSHLGGKDLADEVRLLVALEIYMKCGQCSKE